MARRPLLLLLLALALLAAPARAAAADSPVAAHGMVYLDAPEAFQRTMFAQASAAGASAIRIDLAMSAVLPGGPGAEPDFTAVDRIFDLAREYQLPVLAVVTATPWSWADCGSAEAFAASFRCPPVDDAAWAGLVAEAAMRGRDVLAGVEVLNEPDAAWAFGGGPERYGQMLAAAGSALHAAIPGVPVANGGLSGPNAGAWMERALAQPGAREAIDLLSIHVRGAHDQVAGQVRAWKQWFAARGLDRPLWVTEFGYPSDPAFQTDPAYHDGPDGQARYYADTIPALVAAGAAKVFVTLRDNLGGAYASEGFVGGTVADPPRADAVAQPKPAFLVLADLAQRWPAWAPAG